jgi:hypothetical protein
MLNTSLHCLFKSKIEIKIGRPIKFSKNGFDLLVGSTSVIFGGVSVFHVVHWSWCVRLFLLSAICKSINVIFFVMSLWLQDLYPACVVRRCILFCACSQYGCSVYLFSCFYSETVPRVGECLLPSGVKFMQCLK